MTIGWIILPLGPISERQRVVIRPAAVFFKARIGFGDTHFSFPMDSEGSLRVSCYRSENVSKGVRSR